MNVVDIIFTAGFFYSIIRISTPLLLGTMAAVITENSGALNIVIEGAMLTAAFAGMLVSALTQSVLLGVLGAVLASMLIMSIMALFTLKLGSLAILCGLALNMLASGGTVFFLSVITGQKGTSVALPSLVVPNIDIPLIKDIPFLGEILSGHNVLTYLAFLSVIVMIVLINRTPYGVRLRAAGKNPNAALSTGISVNKMQLSSWWISGLLCGLAGAFMSMGYVSWFTRDMTAGRGWVAIAACILSGGSPKGGFFAAMMFAVAEALANVLGMLKLPGSIVGTIPYVVTLVVLVIYSVIEMKKDKKLVVKSAKTKAGKKG